MLLSFLLTPVYIKIIGIESFAIVGLTFSIQAIFLFMDFGFGAATTIEASQLLAQKKQKDLSSLFRTGEIVYWAVAVFLFAVFICSSNVVTALWLSRVPTELFDLQSIIPLMGGVILSQWPTLFYNGALLGLQRQDLVNRLNLIVATIKGALTLAFLIYISPTIESFLIANLIAGLLHSLGAALFLRKFSQEDLPASGFDLKMFSRIAKKSLKLSALGALNIILIHIDKVILSRCLDLKLFGYYSFCWILIYGMYGFCGILTTFFGPRFSYLNALNEEKKLTEAYHQGCQWMSVLTISATLFFIFFSREILFFWTRDPALVENTYLVASLLVGGSCLSALSYIPQCFQIAKHWTAFTISIQAGSILVWVGLLVVLVNYFGVLGAGLGWAALHLVFLLVYSSVMHRRLLIGEKRRWIVEDLLKPFAGAFSMCSLCWITFSHFMQGFLGILLLFLIAVATIVASGFMASSIRPTMVEFIKRRFASQLTGKMGE